MLRDYSFRAYGPLGPLPPQFELHHSIEKLLLLIGGFGGGKTSAACSKMLIMALENPGTQLAICRKEYRPLRDSTQTEMFNVLADWTNQLGRRGDKYNPESCPFVKRYEKRDMNLIVGCGDNVPSIIRFRNLQDPEDFKSTQYGAIMIDEASELPDENFVLGLYSRMRAKEQREFKIILCTNPPNEEHWIHDIFEKNKHQEDRRTIRFSARNNPFLPDGYIESLETLYQAYPAWIKVNIDGEYGDLGEGDPVYPQFEDSIHVKRVKFDERKVIYRGWDFGFHHPACVWGQIIKNESTGDDEFHVLAEMQGEYCLIDEFGKRAKDFSEETFGVSKKDNGNIEYMDFCDPAGNQRSDKSDKTSVEILRTMNIFPHSYPRTINDGLFVIRYMLAFGDTEKYRKRPFLFIHPDCTTLISGFKGKYQYRRPIRGEKVSASLDDMNPFKDNKYDHLQDALRYLIMGTSFSRFISAREDIQKGKNGDFEFWVKTVDKEQEWDDIMTSYRVTVKKR